MTPLYRDPHFTFRFTDDRVVPRFHVEGVAAGRVVVVYRLDPATGEPAERLADAVAGADGWVELPEPLVVRAGGGFVAVPVG
ncbi:unnamed protein product [Gemmataceae bacterium]|nr:unnamed protein product [Gemmataceae bacterium]VTT97630.1 unnamed protein product [Gemmataceae bacterium]